MLNKVILMGRLTRDPELKYTPSNIAVCSFSIAVDRRFVRAGEQRQTDFINIVAWRQTAEFICKYFTKGRMINICGSIQTRTWDDANGVRRYATEVIADEVNFCGDRPQGGNDSSYGGDGQQSSSQFPDDGFATVDTDDDLPF